MSTIVEYQAIYLTMHINQAEYCQMDFKIFKKIALFSVMELGLGLELRLWDIKSC